MKKALSLPTESHKKIDIVERRMRSFDRVSVQRRSGEISRRQTQVVLLIYYITDVMNESSRSSGRTSSASQRMLPEFDFRMYRVKELAMLYFPSVVNATRSLSALIRRDPLLLGELERIGYRQGIRYLSPEMVRIIVMYLGTPHEFLAIMQPED